jgi:hypothetical protein
MQKRFTTSTYRGLLLSLFVLGLVAALIILPSQFRSEAGSREKSDKDVLERAESLKNLEDYDIRDQKSEEIADILMSFRQTAGRNASDIADIRDGFVRGENTLRQSMPTLAIEYNQQLRNPEVLGPDVMKGGGVMTRASSLKHAETLRNFAIQNNELIGLRSAQINDLKVTADYTNPNGEMSFARLEQFINDIPVFRAEIRAGFNQKGEMFRVVNNLAPGLDYANLPTNFGSPADAVTRAAGYINYQLKTFDTTLNSKASTNLKTVFGDGDWATTAEKMYFPTEAGVARPAWRVLISQDVAFYVIVDSETGTMLYRENITKDQTQTATYNVYANTNSILKVMPDPAPLSPNPIDPSLGTQGTLQPRTNVIAIGNEGAYNFNNLGWMTDNTNVTDGNNVEAGVDHDQVNGVDATVVGTSRVFNFAYTPAAGANNGPGDDPMTSVPYRNGASTNLFYVTNRYHDETYLLGFTEQARNFQNDNFGRGGVGADRVSAEAQDQTLGLSCSTTPCANNANFATPADGGRGRMQMYIWNLVNPIRDGDLDAEVIVHELTHGLFGRLHNGVGGTQAPQMNEGNSDFFAHVLLSLDTDPINGVYVTGGYVTLNLRPAAPFSNVGNYYYGIRRFPKAVIGFTGGPLNRPHNPMTYADIDPAQMSLTNGAFAPAFAGSATGSHDGGEIWSSMLWEVRAKLVARLGNVAGSKKVLQLAMDGMKVAPANPTMLQERNAILAAAQSNGNAADIGDIWGGFALRGMGFGATNTTGNTVVESFSTPNATMIDPFSVSDSTGDNDGFPEPGEPVLLSVSVNNPSGTTITNVTATVTGGGSANYGTMNNGDTVVRQIPYTIPAGAACGSMHDVSITVSSSAGTNTPQVKSFRLGSPVGGAAVSFSNTTPILVPGTGTAAGVGAPYPSTINVTGLTGNKLIKVEFPSYSHQWSDDVDVLLVGPGGQKFIVLSDAGGNTRTNLGPHALSFIDSATTTIPDAGPLAAGTYKPVNYEATDTFDAPAPTGPYSSPAPSGSATFASTFGTDGAAMNGNWSLYIRDDTGADVGTISGWKLTFEANDYACSFTAVAKSRADFDGDGKTDMSVFRGSEGNWYLNRSTAGIQVINWGISTDTLVPGDYDGDGKADVAVFRPSNSAGTPDFYILNSNGFTFAGAEWGLTGDKAVVGNFDGDAKDDIAVWRASNGTFYILNSSNGSNTVEPFGTSGDLPLSMDTDNDGKTNLAVFRPSNNTWYIARNTGVPASNLDAYPFGLAGDKIVPADYDNDNKTDIAVYRNGQWIIKRSSDGVVSFLSWGNSTDVPVPGDYDGDGADDLAIYRAGTWYINRSTSGALVVPFGITTDKPIPTAYIP